MNDTAEINISEISKVIQKRKSTFVGLFLSIVIAAFVVSLIIPPVYRASSKVIIQNENNLYPAGLIPTTSEDKVFLSTQKEIMASSLIINGALEKLQKEGIFKNIDFYSLKNKIVVNYLDESNLLDVSVYLRSPAEAVKLANAIVASFINYHTRARQELINKGLGILNKEKVFTEENIANIEKELAKIKESSDLGDSGLSYLMFLAKAQGQTAEGPTLTLTSVPWMNDIKAKLSEAQANLSKLASEYTEDHPEVVKAHSEVTSLQNSLDQELKKILNSYLMIPNMRVFESAAFPLHKVSPNLPLNMALGICFGLFVGISGALLEERKRSITLQKPLGQPQPAIPAVEKRNMAREERPFVVGYEVKGGYAAGKRYAITENISGTGINIRMKEYLAKGVELSLEIKMDDKDYIYATGKIVWIADSKMKDMFDVGIHFVEIQPQYREKLINYLYGEHYLSKSQR